MRKAQRPETLPPALAPANVAHLAAFEASLASRALHTRNAYLRDAHALASLAGASDMAALSSRDLRRYLATLHGRGLSGRSLARMLSSWRGLYRFLLDRDAAAGNPCEGLKAPKAAKRLPSALSPDEAVRLVDIAGNGPMDVRDRALFELAYSSGLRLSELAGLDVDRVNLASGEVRIWGKGAKERIVPVGAAALAAIRAWLPVRGALPVVERDALFVGRRGKRISGRTIQRRLAQWAATQGLKRHVHPHMLRHSFASHVLQSSGDLRAVQEMLGHASIETTQVYTHVSADHVRREYFKAHPRA